MHRAEYGLAPVFEADQRAPHRQAGDEGARPVDRIEHPDPFGVDPLWSELLAEDTVIGVALGEQAAHRRLRRPVGDRHRIEGAVAELVLDVETGAEMRQDGAAGDFGHVVEKGDEVVGGSRSGHGSLAARG